MSRNIAPYIIPGSEDEYNEPTNEFLSVQMPVDSGDDAGKQEEE